MRYCVLEIYNISGSIIVYNASFDLGAMGYGNGCSYKVRTDAYVEITYEGSGLDVIFEYYDN